MNDYERELEKLSRLSRKELNAEAAHRYIEQVELCAEVAKIRAENEALKARERVLVEALAEVVRHTRGYGELAGREVGARKEVLDLAMVALSAIPEDVRELYRLEREVIDAANKAHDCICLKANGYCEHELRLSQKVAALQAHKEKMSNA